jgi:hypothetical protein
MRHRILMRLHALHRRLDREVEGEAARPDARLTPRGRPGRPLRPATRPARVPGS